MSFLHDSAQRYLYVQSHAHTIYWRHIEHVRKVKGAAALAHCGDNPHTEFFSPSGLLDNCCSASDEKSQAGDDAFLVKYRKELRECKKERMSDGGNFSATNGSKLHEILKDRVIPGFFYNLPSIDWEKNE